jgi:hypothetical protein
LDNADDYQLINTWWPQSKSGSILITARSHIFATSTVANDGLELTGLSDKASVAMILSQIPISARKGVFDEQEEAQKIVNQTSNLALGMQAAIGLINESSCTLQQYNKLYSNIQIFLKDARAEHVYRNFAPYPQGPLEVFTAALTNLKSDARELLEFYSLLDPDPIQDAILDKASEMKTLKHVGFVQNRQACNRSLFNGLIARNLHTDHKRLTGIRIHRLLQHCVRLNMTTTRLNQAFQLATSLVSNSITITHNSIRDPSDYKEFAYHIQSLLDIFRQTHTDAFNEGIVPNFDFVRLLRQSAS